MKRKIVVLFQICVGKWYPSAVIVCVDDYEALSGMSLRCDTSEPYLLGDESRKNDCEPYGIYILYENCTDPYRFVKYGLKWLVRRLLPATVQTVYSTRPIVVMSANLLMCILY